ncbi:PcfJ domain-containing protein [Polaribacter glomeratus]|uniref:Uncharacterized protein n=1 Tax=Polaribacter glomeratus TaxID=102 RepID=A0A2S7WVU1_9FLAO|nr:PcfJ domain-containing protein [Polaribacter glomeratus]PQJ81491.1 hypothetical protein BTO16_02385 [Polaribacter glomeratus]TXD64681.1 hypothetical protein ESX12_14180 [Polaribacter glomeratus]
MNHILLTSDNTSNSVAQRFNEIEITLTSFSNKLRLLNLGIIRGIKEIKNWELYQNMTTHQFNKFLEALIQINELNLFITLERKRNQRQLEINFAKLLVICSVFNNYMNMPLINAIKKNINHDNLDPNELFSKLFNTYEVSKDFTNSASVIEDFIYNNFKNATFNNRNYIEFDYFKTYEDFTIILGIRNGKNIRKLNPTALEISKKESFYFHSQDNLLSVQNSENYIKKRIIASKLAIICEENTENEFGFNRTFTQKINLIENYLESSDTFRDTIDKYYTDIYFWKSGFRILMQSHCNPHEIQTYVDYIENQRNHLGSNFTLKGKTYKSIINQMEVWHDTITYNEIEGNPIVWGTKEEGALKTITVKDKIYEYQQIIDSFELYIEGQKKKHCVYTYLDRCVEKKIQIWRLYEKNTNYGLTMEIKNGKITQALGKFNMADHYLERNVLTVMAKRENLKIYI